MQTQKMLIRIQCSALLFLVSLSALLPRLSRAESPTVDGVVSIPLIPHHIQKSRRLERYSTQENGERQQQHTPADYVVDEHVRSHCPRFQLLDLLEAQQDGSERRLENAFPAEQVAALFQGYGTHYADLWCGTPPQRQTVIVDTGSGITAFPCSQCNDCGVPKYHIDELFHEDDSTTFQTLKCGDCLKGHCDHSHCRMGQSYQEGSSWSAHEVQDQCYVGGLHTEPVLKDDNGKSDLDPYHAPNFAFPLKFGCQTKITGLFKTQMADGIMGMDIAKAAFWQQMYQAGRIRRQAFSMCFSRSPTASRDGTGAGAMSLGGTDQRLHSTRMVYSKTEGSVGFYAVHIRKAYLRDDKSKGKNANIVPIRDATEEVLNKGKVIVDSGTTDTYFHKKFRTPFYRAFAKMSGKDYSNSAKKLTQEQLESFPTILFQLRGDEELNKQVLEDNKGEPVPGLAGDLDPDHPYDVLLAIPPTHYFEYDEEDGMYTSRFYADETRGSVFGANTMMGHDVLFDIEDNKLGWAESDCNYRKLVDTYFDGKVLPPPPDKNNDKGAPNDQDRFKPEDQDAEKLEKAPAQFCTGIGCQMSLAITLVGAVVLLGMRLLRSASDEQVEFELTEAELEMQTPPSAMDDDDKEQASSSFSSDGVKVEHGEFS